MYHDVIKKKILREGLLHSAMIELTYRCNLDCFFCYNPKEAPGKPLEYEQYLSLFDELADMQVLFLSLTGGEPLAHPRFFDIGRAARERGFVIRLKSNGHAIRGRLAERLKREVNPFQVEMSLHGASAATHDRQTREPGSFDRLLENIAQMHELALRPSLVSTLTAWNEHELEQMFELADRLAVSLRFQGPVGPRDDGDTTPLAIQPTPQGWERLMDVARARQTPRDDSAAASKKSPQSDDGPDMHCGAGSEGVLIDPFGNVVPCLHLRWPAGNLHERSMREIWTESAAFPRARNLSRQTAVRFHGVQPVQLGAPLFCPGLEKKGCSADCATDKAESSLNTTDVGRG